MFETELPSSTKAFTAFLWLKTSFLLATKILKKMRMNYRENGFPKFSIYHASLYILLTFQ